MIEPQYDGLDMNMAIERDSFNDLHRELAESKRREAELKAYIVAINDLITEVERHGLLAVSVRRLRDRIKTLEDALTSIKRQAYQSLAEDLPKEVAPATVESLGEIACIALAAKEPKAITACNCAGCNPANSEGAEMTESDLPHLFKGGI
jgi:hypothetical protein